MLKRRPVLVAAALVLAVMLAISQYGYKLFDRIFAPWAFPSGDRPALVGNWGGTLVTSTGKRFAVYLRLILPQPKLSRHGGYRRGWREQPNGPLGGQLVICDRPNMPRIYEVEGTPNDRHASNFTFFAAPKLGTDGLTASWVNAAWSNPNRIDGQVQFHWRRGPSAISGPQYPDTQGEGVLSLVRTGTAADTTSCNSANISQAQRLVAGLVFSGPVTDAAEILDRQQEEALAVKLRELLRTTGHQMVVVSVRSLDGTDEAIFATRVANRWGIGGKSGDGVVLLVAPGERKVRIAVGRGLEQVLPDALCQQIMDNRIVPRFRAGDFAGGLNAGVDAVVSHLM
jgi:uncharacterized protein